MDIIYILGNLHRFIRQRRAPTPVTPRGFDALDGRKRRSAADRAFLTRAVSVAVLLVVSIVVLWAMI
jgi:hypothetical protein